MFYSWKPMCPFLHRKYRIFKLIRYLYLYAKTRLNSGHVRYENITPFLSSIGFCFSINFTQTYLMSSKTNFVTCRSCETFGICHKVNLFEVKGLLLLFEIRLWMITLYDTGGGLCFRNFAWRSSPNTKSKCSQQLALGSFAAKYLRRAINTGTRWENPFASSTSFEFYDSISTFSHLNFKKYQHFICLFSVWQVHVVISSQNYKMVWWIFLLFHFSVKI